MLRKNRGKKSIVKVDICVLVVHHCRCVKSSLQVWRTKRVCEDVTFTLGPGKSVAVDEDDVGTLVQILTTTTTTTMPLVFEENKSLECVALDIGFPFVQQLYPTLRRYPSLPFVACAAAPHHSLSRSTVCGRWDWKVSEDY